MSCDAMYAIRRAGRDSFFAGRWSAPHIGHTLLRGPEHIDEYVGHLDLCEGCVARGFGSLLRLGPRVVALAQIGGPRPGMLRPGLERDVRETLFIDEARRSVHWWQADPPWAHPGPGCAALWPGRILELDEGGLRSHVERSGREFAAIRMTRDERLAALIDQVPRTLRGDFATLPRLACASAVTEHPEIPADVMASLVALADGSDD